MNRWPIPTPVVKQMCKNVHQRGHEGYWEFRARGPDWKTLGKLFPLAREPWSTETAWVGKELFHLWRWVTISKALCRRKIAFSINILRFSMRLTGPLSWTARPGVVWVQGHASEELRHGSTFAHAQCFQFHLGGERGIPLWGEQQDLEFAFLRR